MQPDQRDIVYFAAIETDTLEPRTIPDPGVRLAPAQVSSSEKIVNGFLESHERLLGEEDVRRRIEQIENIFMLSGRFAELMVIFRDDFEKRGTDSHVADRYAWGLIRMGQRKRSREVINQLLVARPTDARIHFLDGAAYLQEQPPTASDFPKIVRAWERVIEFDPNYEGYDSITAEMLRLEIDRFKAQMPSSELAEVELAAQVEAQNPKPVETPPEPVEVVEEVEEVEEVAVEPVPEPAVVPPAPRGPAHSDDQLYRLQIAKGQIALGRSDYPAAEEAFILAKGLKPGDFEAEFGHLSAGWGTTAARHDVATGMRKLAERDDLTPAQRIELGTFLWTKLGRKDMAAEQWNAAKSADPSVAKRVDALLKQIE